MEVWDWIERLSWLAGTIGLVAALWLGVPQLRHIRDEQRRIADELTSRPELDVGFTLNVPRRATRTFERNAISIAPNWKSGQLLSEPTHLCIVIYNVGQKTARNVYVTTDFPLGIRTPPNPPVGDASGGYIVENRATGVAVRARQATLHPEQGAVASIELQIPRGTSQIRATVRAAMDDVPIKETEFLIRIQNN